MRIGQLSEFLFYLLDVLESVAVFFNVSFGIEYAGIEFFDGEVDIVNGVVDVVQCCL